MRFNRPLRILELEDRIVPSHTEFLDAGIGHTTSFTYTDSDGDSVEVIRDATNHGSIAVMDNDATSALDFTKVDSIVFDAACDTTTTLSVQVTDSTVGSDGIATVGYIDFTAPLAIQSIEVEGDVIGDTSLAPTNDSIAGSTLDSLWIRVGDTNTAAGGNIAANNTAIPPSPLLHAINLSAGLAGSITVDAAITGADAYAVFITGNVTGSITVGDMTDEGIKQEDSVPLANEAISSATISITGNEAQSLKGNLGCVLSDGFILATTVDVAGDFDTTNLKHHPSGASLADCMSTDWDRNGVGTMTDVTVNVAGNVVGEFTNDFAIASGFWTEPGCLQDISSLVLNIGGSFGGNVVSGGSIVDSTFTVNPTGTPTESAPDIGRFSANVLAFEDVDNLAVHARVIGGAAVNPIIAADAEAEAKTLFNLPPSFDPTLNSGKDFGGITDLYVTATEDVNAIIGNDLADNNGVGDDVAATLTAGTNVVLTADVARNLTLNATGTTTFEGDITTGRDATIGLDFLSVENTIMDIGRDLALTPNTTNATSFDAIMYVGRDANVHIRYGWIHATLEAGRNIVADVLADDGPNSANTINFMVFDADHDYNGVGTLSGSIESHLGLDTGSLIHGATITANVTLERFPGALGADMDMHGQISAGLGGITSDISIDGSLRNGLTSTGNVTGHIVIGKNLISSIDVTGNVNSLDIGGSVLNALPPVQNEIDVSGNLTSLHIGGNVGPGIGPSDTVFIHAANFGTLQIDGNVLSFVDILAGAEPGTGTITSLIIGGTAVPTHLLADGTSINQIRANTPALNYDHLVPIGNKTVQFQLESSIGGGTLKIRVANGSAKFLYSDPDADGKLDTLVGLQVDGGKPNITVTVTGNNSLATLGVLSAPSYVIPSATSTTLFRSVNNVEFQNINVGGITISGSAKSIHLVNGNLVDCTIGDVLHPNGLGVGNLTELVLQGNLSKGTGNLSGNLNVLHDLTNKVEAMDITGSITVGHNAKSIIARHDLEATITVHGDLKEIGADNDTNGINKDIIIDGSLGNLKASKAPFFATLSPSTVEIMGRLTGVFDVLGKADTATRIVQYPGGVTTAQYVNVVPGGLLVVHSFVNARNIK